MIHPVITALGLSETESGTYLGHGEWSATRDAGVIEPLNPSTGEVLPTIATTRVPRAAATCRSPVSPVPTAVMRPSSAACRASGSTLHAVRGPASLRFARAASDSFSFVSENATTPRPSCRTRWRGAATRTRVATCATHAASTNGCRTRWRCRWNV